MLINNYLFFFYRWHNIHTKHTHAQIENFAMTSVRGNTKSANVRSRNWFFTLNNYTESDIKFFQTLPDCNYVFQQEMGETKTPHLQGVLMFKNARSLGGVKKIHGRAHWEVPRCLSASVSYCCKSDTRFGDIFTNIDLSKYRESDDKQPEVVGAKISYLEMLEAERLRVLALPDNEPVNILTYNDFDLMLAIGKREQEDLSIIYDDE